MQPIDKKNNIFDVFFTEMREQNMSVDRDGNLTHGPMDPPNPTADPSDLDNSRVGLVIDNIFFIYYFMYGYV